jgi:hypothetical protein
MNDKAIISNVKKGVGKIKTVSKKIQVASKKLNAKVKSRVKDDVVEIRSQVFDKTSILISSALGMVAALAWNDAIKSTFDYYFPPSGGAMIAKIVYALFITVVAVAFTIWINRMFSKINLKKN